MNLKGFFLVTFPMFFALSCTESPRTARIEGYSKAISGLQSPESNSPEFERRLAALEGKQAALEKALERCSTASAIAPAAPAQPQAKEPKSAPPPSVTAAQPSPAPSAELSLPESLLGKEARIVLWHSYRGAEKKVLQDLTARFNERFAPLRLEIQEVPFQAIRDKITVTIPRGTGPDLFVFAHNAIGDWVDKGGIIQPLGPFLEPYGSTAAAAKRFLPLPLKALALRGALWGLPLAFKSHALFINTALIKTAPADSDQLLAMALEATKGQGEDRVFGLLYDAGKLYNHALWVHGFGGSITSDDDLPTLNSPGFAKSLDFVRSLVVQGVLPPDVNDAMVTSMFNSGRVAMVINGPWFLGEIDKAIQYEVAALPSVPGHQKAAPYLGSEGLFLSAATPSPEAAFFVIWWLTSDEAARQRYLDGGQLVANAAVYQDAQLTSAALPALGVFLEQAKDSVIMPSSARMQAVWSTADNAIRKVIYGGVAATEALEEAQKKALSDISGMKGAK